ncbi:fibroblast growth factor 19 [Genypterus blacodes]|uniref:fibroblast growth factor 19 n=1 Tax=Genypterus blacodes TaxID=154954 RepID=UPI003F7710FE
MCVCVCLWRSRGTMRVSLFTVSASTVLFAAGLVCLPLPDEGPNVSLGWTQVVRLRHLYAARPGLHLRIGGDGQIHGSEDQSPHSLLEIRPVDPGCVAIRGVEAARFLCMEADGRLYASPTFLSADCSFREQILADGYSVYASDTHGVLLSLGNPRQRQQGRDRGVSALARFLPRISTLDLGLSSGPEVPERPLHQQEPLDLMDSFGTLAQMIHSPSFTER